MTFLIKEPLMKFNFTRLAEKIIALAKPLSVSQPATGTNCTVTLKNNDKKDAGPAGNASLSFIPGATRPAHSIAIGIRQAIDVFRLTTDASRLTTHNLTLITNLTKL